MCAGGIRHRSSAAFVLQRLASKAADNVTETWQVRTSESKAGANERGQGTVGFLKRLGLQHARVAIACTMGACSGEKREGGEASSKTELGLAPWPAKVHWEGESAIVAASGFGRPTEPLGDPSTPTRISSRPRRPCFFWSEPISVVHER